MRALLPVLLLTAAGPPIDHPRTYLLSIVDVPLGRDEAIGSFSFSTWGASFRAVCHIPAGWRLSAGGAATPDGTLSGTGSQGATWFRKRSPEELRNIVLVTLVAPVQRRVRQEGTGVVPATFAGHAVLSADPEDRAVKLTYRNVRLVPARRCP